MIFLAMDYLRESNLGKPFFLVYADYKTVFLDFCRFIYKKPLKALRNVSAFGVAVAIFYSNPSADSYTSQLMDNANTLALLSEKVRNTESDMVIRRLTKLNCQHRLAVYNCGFFSLVCKQEHNDWTSLYEARCYYLKDRWLYIYRNIVDIGFLCKWYYLDKAMIDYDVNESEL